MAAPMTGPVRRPAPPMITTSRNRIDWKNEKLDGLTKVVSGAKSAPATPASTADMVNASVRIDERIDADGGCGRRFRIPAARIATPHALAARPPVTDAARRPSSATAA